MTVVFPLAHSDPVQAFWAAHSAGHLIGLDTSGTVSGAGRTIVRTTRSWVDSFDAVATWIDFRPTDRIWIPGPLTATMNLFAACLAAHCNVPWGTQPDAATIVALTPTGLSDLLSDQLPHPTLTKAIVAGDALAPPLAAQASAAGIQTLHYYGSSETSLVAIGRHAADLHLFDRVQLRVRQHELWVSSPWLSQGYLASDQHLRRRADWVSVQDLGTRHGDRITVWGRNDGLTIGGQTIALGPLAQLLQARVSAPVVLVGVPHPRLGRVLACVTTNSTDLQTLQDWARRALTGAERPRLWRTVGRLPITAAGKVDRPALSRLLAHPSLARTQEIPCVAQ